MMDNHKRFHLAVLVLKASYLLMKNMEIACELISKVVNYDNRFREFSIFLLEKWQAHIRPERIQH